jgi:hypothetical protein
VFNKLKASGFQPAWPTGQVCGHATRRCVVAALLGLTLPQTGSRQPQQVQVKILVNFVQIQPTTNKRFCD